MHEVMFANTRFFSGPLCATAVASNYDDLVRKRRATKETKGAGDSMGSAESVEIDNGTTFRPSKILGVKVRTVGSKYIQFPSITIMLMFWAERSSWSNRASLGHLLQMQRWKEINQGVVGNVLTVLRRCS